MARQNAELLTFNRGLVSPLALARTDIKRVGLSAETQTNWMPLSLGPMSLRAGLGYLGATLSNAAARFLPFIFAVDDVAVLELTNNAMRVWINDALVTRPSVASTITNGNFTTDVSGWADADEGGSATSYWATWNGSGTLALLGDGTYAASRVQQVTVATASTEHAVRVVVAYGTCHFRIGSNSDGDQYVADTLLEEGTYSFAFTPSSTFWIKVYSKEEYISFIESITMEAAGVLSLPTSWGSSNLSDVRYDQSGDVMFVGCKNVVQKRIARRGARSWSVERYASNNGPYLLPNTSETTIYASALTGNVVLHASKNIWTVDDIGSVLKLVSKGQDVIKAVTAENMWTNPIKVTGAVSVAPGPGTERDFTVDITGWTAGTVTLQRSVGSPGDWQTVKTYAANTTVTYQDGLSNQIIYYRLGVDRGSYSATVSCRLYNALGSIIGRARITLFSDAAQVIALVTSTLGSTLPTSNWSEGAWSPRRGYPSAVALHEGRLWWAGKDKEWGSVTDGFDNFDDEYVGDAGPISRSIGNGPVDTVNWLQSNGNLLLGGQGAEHVGRSSSFGEPLTPTNFNMKTASTNGSAAIDPIKVDDATIFVDRSGIRVYELNEQNLGKYSAVELTSISPEVCLPYVVRTGVQRQPNTRIHFVLSDGTVALLVYDKNEEVRAWIKIETSGSVEDVVILPGALGSTEDQVYYVVNRTVNGSTVRYLEKWAKASECVGGTLNKQADSFVSISQASSTTITGLSHLEGKSVVCWANGKDLGTYTVASGGITVSEAVTTAIVGLTYTARYKSTKLAHAAQAGSALAQKKRVDHLGLLLANTHYQGLRYGPDFDTLDDLPLVEEGANVAADTVHSYYDADSVEFNGEYDTDSRICLEASAPRPCTVMGLVLSMTTHEKI